jgi:hypothetical protein
MQNNALQGLLTRCAWQKKSALAAKQIPHRIRKGQ